VTLANINIKVTDLYQLGSRDRVDVGLRLGLSLCVPHQCQCGSLVSSTEVHSFVCKKAPGRTARHHALNDLIARTLVSAGIPVTKEPNDLSRSDGRRPEGLNLVPWKEGKPLPWDTSVVCTVADSCSVCERFGERRALRRRRRHSVRRPSMRLCCEFIFLRRLLWNCWGLWKKRLRHFRPSWVTGSRHCLEIVVRLAFCFNGFLFLCSDLTPFCCGKVLLHTAARRMTYRVINLT